MAAPATARGRRGLAPLAAVLAVALAVALSGCASGGGTPAAPAPAAQTTEPAPDAADDSASMSARSEPTAIDIPKLGAHSTLIPLGLNPDKTVQVPPVSQPQQAGWYAAGPTPGELGPAVILGHVDGNKQPGIFFHLKDLVPGDQVNVSRQDGSTLTFTVRAVDKVDKNKFPTDAVYGNTADPELRLITCGGAFDPAAHNYLDNIIVYATLS